MGAGFDGDLRGRRERGGGIKCKWGSVNGVNGVGVTYALYPSVQISSRILHLSELLVAIRNQIANDK